MASQNRSDYRNIRIFDPTTGAEVAGAFQSGSITEENLLWALGNVILVVEDVWALKDVASGRTITGTTNPVAPGNYEIHSRGRVSLSDELWVARLFSHSVSGRDNAFRDGVRHRDGRCVISGTINSLAYLDRWRGYTSAHIFPLASESLWIQNGYGRWITDMDGTSGVSRINSVQNGLLIAGNLHTCFDSYEFSINPDDNYKITSFVPDDWNIDGRVLDPVCRNPTDPHRASDELLRWHFRQAVLANMRGAGEPTFEHDFPPGTDMLATWQDEPYGKERFEMALETKLGCHQQGARSDDAPTSPA